MFKNFFTVLLLFVFVLAITAIADRIILKRLKVVIRR